MCQKPRNIYISRRYIPNLSAVKPNRCSSVDENGERREGCSSSGHREAIISKKTSFLGVNCTAIGLTKKR
jgi:hypothetical protein